MAISIIHYSSAQDLVALENEKKIALATAFHMHLAHVRVSKTLNDYRFTVVLPAGVYTLSEEVVKIFLGLELKEIEDSVLTELKERASDMHDPIEDPRGVVNLANFGLRALPPIGGARNIVTLDLSENQLSELPASIQFMTALKQLYLDGNRLAALPEWIAGLRGLSLLSLNRNRFTIVPLVLGELENLEELRLNPQVPILLKGRSISVKKEIQPKKLRELIKMAQLPTFEILQSRYVISSEEPPKDGSFNPLAPGKKLDVGGTLDSRICRAVDWTTGKPIAIRFAPFRHGDWSKDPFKTEIDASVDRSYLIKYREAPAIITFGTERLFCAFMEPVHGCLYSLIHGSQSLNLKAIERTDAILSNFMKNLISGVAALHDHGITHGNLHMGSIFFYKHGEDYTLKIANDSYSRSIINKMDHSPYWRFQLGYAAPEVVWGDVTKTPASDTYSLGILFWEILTGCYPGEKHIRDTITADKVGPIDMMIVRSVGSDGKATYPKESDLHAVIRYTLNKFPFAKACEMMLLNMIRANPMERKPQRMTTQLIQELPRPS